jgi:hypothetical protein
MMGTMEREIAAIVTETGAKFIVLADSGPSGWGMTEDEAWLHAESRHPDTGIYDGLGDTELYHTAPHGARIETRHDYLSRQADRPRPNSL